MPTPSSAETPPLSAWGRAADPTEVTDRLDRQLQVVFGKGGVGRTLISCALAKRAADAGRRTLLLEVDAPDSAARQLRVRPAVDHPREVLNNLWLCRMTPAGSMKEYALLTLRFETLYRMVFENRLVKYFLRSIPSLGEFTMLGKAWHHATESWSYGDGPRFERVIIDAPATGHAITFFSLARLVADVAPPGRMAEASTAMAELVEDHAKTCFHLVTLPEEMPVNEALELNTASRERLKMAPGIAVVNRRWSPLLRPEEAAWVRGAPVGDETLAPYLRVARRRLVREASQQAHIDRFVREVGAPWLAVPERSTDAVGHGFVDEIGRRLDAFAAGDVDTLRPEVAP